MKYFLYNKKRDSNLSLAIWEELNALKYYAISLYKGNWEDALNDSYMHLMENYDESKGELSHYAIRVVATIYMNKYIQEVKDDEILQTESDKESYSKYMESDELDTILDKDYISEDNIKNCEDFIIPMFVEDFLFFKSMNPKDKKLNYEFLHDVYPDIVIAKAFNNLMEKYGNSLSRLYELKKSCTYHDYSADRYKKSFDSAIEFECSINNVILYRKKTKYSATRKIHKVNIKRMVNSVMYRLEDILSQKVGNLTVWCTLSGFISYDIEKIKAKIESELIGKILSGSINIKVLAYEKGSCIYLTSTQDLPEMMYHNILGRSFGVEIQKVVSKVV